MNRYRTVALIAVFAIVVGWAVAVQFSSGDDMPAGRERVVFWHFWGGAERQAVRDVVRRFNASQERYWVEEVAVPGQNLDMKFFMSLAGGDAPDVLNQDEQVIAQWAEAGVIVPVRKLTASEAEYQELIRWLGPAARRIGTYDGQLYAVCNAIDIRALFYRTDILDGDPPPETIAELDAIAKRPPPSDRAIYYLPDDRRLWAWGVAFGGDFYDEATGRVTPDDPRIIAALEWMVSYTKYLGLNRIRAFRSTNREAGAGSMLLDGRYGLMMDGQWRVAELDDAGLDYGVVPLPFPPGGLANAGWVNGNFFVVPHSAGNKRGAWEFIKFWSGFDGHESEAAATAASGGWIPASPRVVAEPGFQTYLAKHPKFRLFVDLAASPHQMPTPTIPVQAYYFERVNRATEEAMALKKSPREALEEAARDVQRRLDAVRSTAP